MSISIDKIREATSKEWDSTWHKCDYTTYFHSREWAEIWQKYDSRTIKTEAKLIEFSDKKKAIVPVTYKKALGFRKSLMLSPAGTFGGWISTDILSLEHGQLITDYFTKSTNPFNGFTWRINPYDDIVQQCSFQNVDVKFDSTQVLNIACGFDKIVKNWTKGHRSTTRKARKARKEGVSIRVADSRHDWLQYFKIYEASIERWGKKASSNYKWTLFDTICKLSSPNVKLWLAEHDNEIIAGALCFYGKKQVVYWHGAALSTYFKFRPVNLLMYEAINDACKEGYSWFDFNPSGGHQGVQAFKKSFGTQERPCAVITLNSSIMRLVIARKNKKRKRL